MTRSKPILVRRPNDYTPPEVEKLTALANRCGLHRLLAPKIERAWRRDMWAIVMDEGNSIWECT